jgi:NAD/NADP transhydrogenase beta subunit
MAAGQTDLDNGLFLIDTTMMVFGDAKKVAEYMANTALA